MNKKIKLEYVWLDGYKTQNIRSKTRYIEMEDVDLQSVPSWSFDGSSTMQAPGENSDCILNPVKVYKNPCDAFFYKGAYIVLCEVMNSDGSPHKTNHRAKLRNIISENEDRDMWFGIEQEYVVMDPKTNRPYGWPEKGFPNPQGRYYCGVGGDAVSMRYIAEEHALYCNDIGIPLCGTNAEVMLAQWEYQIGTAGPLEICDDLWISRYIMEILAESNESYITLDPKPIKGDWNGSGAHINFSTKYMREVGGKEYIESICLAMGENHEEHIDVYGVENNRRLTGDHETQHIGEFSYGDSDRGASIRIPPSTVSSRRGYLEDRRPAANMNPYEAVYKIMKSVCRAEEIHLTELSDRKI
jgi:glutamine synthetase